MHAAAGCLAGRQLEQLEGRGGVGRQRIRQHPDQVVAGVPGPVAVGGERQTAAQVLAEQIADHRDPPGVLGRVMPGHEHRPVARHRPAHRREQLRQQLFRALGVQEGLGSRPVDDAVWRRAGQLGQFGAVDRAGPPQGRLPQLYREERAEVQVRCAGHQRVGEVVARAARIISPGEHHVRGDGGAGRIAQAVRQDDRVGLRFVRRRFGLQPARGLINSALLHLAQDIGRDTRRGRVELVTAVTRQPVLAGCVEELLKGHASLT